MNKQLKIGAIIAFASASFSHTGRIVYADDDKVTVALDQGSLYGHSGSDFSTDVVTVSADYFTMAKACRLWNVWPKEVLTVNGKPFVLNPPAKPKSSLSPQCNELLGLLQSKGSVTDLEAQGVYRIRSLSRRVCDLKAAGYKVSRVLSNDKTGQRYARYYLAA